MKTVRKGDIVRLSEAVKRRMRTTVSGAHAREFGSCVGFVNGLTDYHNDGDVLGTKSMGPEVDVLWRPSGLRYAYHPKDLELVKKAGR